MARKPQSRWATPMGDLHKLLTKAFPEHRTATHEVLDISWLAEKLDMTREGVYKWLRDDTIPVARARELVKIRGCRIKLQDLLPYLA